MKAALSSNNNINEQVTNLGQATAGKSTIHHRHHEHHSVNASEQTDNSTYQNNAASTDVSEQNQY